MKTGDHVTDGKGRTFQVGQLLGPGGANHGTDGRPAAFVYGPLSPAVDRGGNNVGVAVGAACGGVAALVVAYFCWRSQCKSSLASA